MKNIFEDFRKFVKESAESIEDLVNHYYSDLPEEEVQKKIAIFSSRLNKGIEQNGEWMRKTLMHSLEQKMKIEKKRRSRSPEEEKADAAAAEKASLRSKEQSREMARKYGRRWNR
jgi:hypothetical protein